MSPSGAVQMITMLKFLATKIKTCNCLSHYPQNSISYRSHINVTVIDKVKLLKNGLTKMPGKNFVASGFFACFMNRFNLLITIKLI